MRRKIYLFIMAAIATVMMTSCYSLAVLSHDIAYMEAVGNYGCYGPLYSRYSVYCGSVYLPQYNCTVWGGEHPYQLQIGSLIISLDQGNNIVVREGNGYTVVIPERGEKKYRVNGYLVEVLNAGWESVYITNPYGYRKQFILLPYQR